MKTRKKIELMVATYPVLINILIAVNFVSCFTGHNFTNVIYPILGNSVIFDILLLCLFHYFKYCTWNRFLIYSALINIVVEWIIVNFDVGCYYNNIMVVTAVISSVLAVGSVLSAIRNKVKGLD